ncbi:MAG TPA: ATP-binding protein [Pseudonocardiaceae bacterium]|nr:ATP-binding protein [Pseudonocardiaceae bacterium]
MKTPQRTIRLRLTLLYGGLFVVAGAALLAITYFLVASNVGGVTEGLYRVSAIGVPQVVVGANPPTPLPTLEPDEMVRYMQAQAVAARSAELRQLLTLSGVALVIMAALSVLLGWLVAGRALLPLRAMTGKARQISEANLHERLAVTGPDDELKELGDTFDGLLGRLDSAFAAQKRFVANASHELRTPLTLQRAMLEVALTDPAADTDTLRRVCQRVLATGEEQERMIEALLTLARSQRGLDVWQHVDLARITTDVVAGHGRGLATAIEAASTVGDDRLVERLVANLVENAVRHNVPGGWVRVDTSSVDGQPMLRVANSGPVIPPDRVGALFQPFLRMAERTGTRDGHGLGLSIVAAIADAHGAVLTVTANPDGGLTVTVLFPDVYNRRVSSTSSTAESPSLATR